MGTEVTFEQRDFFEVQTHLISRKSWIAHGEGASIEFWLGILKYPKDHPFSSYFNEQPCYPGGFEIHSRSGRGDPDHEHCPILDGPCWHDGSSLAADKFFQTWNQSDNMAFVECEH